jgi:hypothetical protein
MFTRFTSCIGVLGVVGKKVIGVHLALKDRDGNHVKGKDIDKVDKLLRDKGYKLNSVILLGHIAIWEKNAPEALTRLRIKYNTTRGNAEHRWGDGTYGGKIEGDVLKPDFE